jgi:hypothetical protein
MIHWDDKRPITVDILKRLSIEKLAARLGNLTPALRSLSQRIPRFLATVSKRELLAQRGGHHHRLAFYYWVHSTSDWTTSLPHDALAPDLMTVDWHDDVGCDADCVFDELRLLVDRLEVENLEDPASRGRRKAAANQQE